MTRKDYTIWVALFLGFFWLIGCSMSMKANTQLSKENYKGAITLYKEHLAHNPDDVQARSKLGFSNLKAGRLDEAASEFESTLKAKPGYPFSVLYLGLVYLSQEKFDKAIMTWQGYRNKKKPLVEEEIKRQLTLLLTAHKQREAWKPLAKEGRDRTPVSSAPCLKDMKGFAIQQLVKKMEASINKAEAAQKEADELAEITEVDGGGGCG